MKLRPSASWPAFMGGASLVLAGLWPLQAHALFDDDEARKAILDLRQKFDAYRQDTDAKLGRLMSESRDAGTASQRSMLELSNQNEQLRAEIARLRGQNEQLARDVAELQRQQKDAQAGVDARLRQVEPAKVSLDGAEFTAAPEEKRDYDAAMELLRKSDFAGAASAYTGFLRRFPGSGYTPSALYWLGNAQYANRSYKEAIESHRRLVAQYPTHQRTPEAMLAMANSQIELKDGKVAQRTLETLVRSYPQSEAAAAGRERLAKIR
ncbi:tol-pal system protein YbgF [Hydrogenophaga sp. RWCD_12]|uniref:tol-pal system protein YbgF n=1 Tax=Hydrogenophaga sp. RWCD_12 TaxID=3391190 RepID=UPI003984CD8A